MPAYHLSLTGTFEADTWDEALVEAERLRLTISVAREHPTSTPFAGTVSDGHGYEALGPPNVL